MRTISIYLILTLLLGSFVVPQILVQNGSGSEPTRASLYISPDANVDIDLEYLVENSPGTVTREDGCYQFHNDVFIEESDTFTIEPGQVLKFVALARLTIRGTLIADGTPENPINFTQDPEGDWPTYWPSHWQGIHLESTSTSSIIDNCIIEHAALSLLVRSGSSNIVSNIYITSYFGGFSGWFDEGIELENITIDGGRGLTVYSGEDVLLKDCSIRTSSGYALDLNNADAVLENCTLHGLEGMIELRYATAELRNTYVNPWNLSFERNSSQVFEVDGTFLDVFDINGEPVNGVHANITDTNGNVILDTVLPAQSSRWWMEIYSVIYQDKNSDTDCLDEGETSHSYPYHVQLWKDGFMYYNESVVPDDEGNIVVYMVPFLNCSTPIGPVSFDEDSGEGYGLVDIMDHYNLEGPDNVQIQVSHMEDENNITCAVNGTKLDFFQVHENWNGEARFQVMVKNGSNVWVKSNFFTVTVVFIQDAPVLENITEDDVHGELIFKSMVEDQTFMSRFNASDPDGDRIFFSSYDIPDWISLTADTGGILAYPTNEHVGIHIFNVTVKDEFDLSSTSKVMVEVINVNDPPSEAEIIVPNDTRRLFENNSVNLTFEFLDEDLLCTIPCDDHTFTWSSNISGFLGTGELLSLKNLTVGRHLITLEITDSHGESVSVTEKIVILPIIVKEDADVKSSYDGGQVAIVIILVIVIIILIGVVITFSFILYKMKNEEEESLQVPLGTGTQTEVSSDPINP